jgi:hypothetical protein
MLGERILAGIFAVLILIKLALLAINPKIWLGMAQAFLGHASVVMVFYLILLAISGYFIFTTVDLIDVAVVMLFTGLLVGLSLIPYAASFPKVSQDIVAVGFGRAWVAWVLWVAIAVAVLVRLFAKER